MLQNIFLAHAKEDEEAVVCLYHQLIAVPACFEYNIDSLEVLQKRLFMKPLSLDLRQKIVDVYTDEDISQRQLAKRFRVSLSTVQRLLKRLYNGEGIEPKGHGGGYPPLLNPEQLERVKELIEANNDATLAELRELVFEQEGVRVSRSTMGRITQTLELTRKKNTSC